MEGTLTFLGTGTSMGVPTLGCGCAVCTSSDPHDRRLRPSALLRWTEAASVVPSVPPIPRNMQEAGPSTSLRRMGHGTFPPKRVERSVLIDTGPDFREQALRAGIVRVDAVLYTHAHADHIMGMDDLRPLSFISALEGGPIPLYATEETAAVLKHVYDYTFSPDATYMHRAKVELMPMGARTLVHGVEFVRVPIMHGEMEISGFRFGDMAYLTDVSAIPESSFALLRGLEHLAISALRHKPHPNHATVEQALAWARRIGARHTWLTHIAHDLGHEETNRSLPDGVRVAYDGLTIPVKVGN